MCASVGSLEPEQSGIDCARRLPLPLPLAGMTTTAQTCRALVHGEDAARPLWRELLDYVRNHMEDDERLEALNVIHSNAPWFANECPQHFQL